MKKLTNLDVPQESYDEPKAGDKLPTYRELLRIGLGRIIPKSTEESLDLSIVLKKLRGKDSEVDLENGEFKTMKETIGKNEAKMFQGSHGPLMDWIIACEKASETKTPLEVK